MDVAGDKTLKGKEAVRQWMATTAGISKLRRKELAGTCQFRDSPLDSIFVRSELCLALDSKPPETPRLETN